jgi:hypothetical protein
MRRARLVSAAKKQRKSRSHTRKSPVFIPNSTGDQSVRRKVRPLKINEFGSGYQPNLHSRQGTKNNGIAPDACANVNGVTATYGYKILHSLAQAS